MASDRAGLFRRQAMFWTVSAVVAGLLLWLFSGILLPFVFGMAIAYFLNPVANWLERRGLSRLMASILILVAFALVFAGILLLVVPVVGGQVSAAVEHMPDLLDRLQALLAEARKGPLRAVIPGDDQSFRQALGRLASQGSSVVASVLSSVWTSSLAVINFLSLFIVTPVVAFYLLLDWDRMIARTDDCIPRQHLVTVRRIARDIDRSVAGFIRGQGSVCLILGTYYAIGLTLVGLSFGTLIGLFTGMISFIPYVGSAVGLLLAVGVALVQFWPDWIWIAATLAVFFTGQFVEGNILQPKLVGASVGLHPVWLMFALFAFGALFGFVGLLIAVPAAAAVGVLVRFAVARYKESELYFGRSGAGAIDLIGSAHGSLGAAPMLREPPAADGRP